MTGLSWHSFHHGSPVITWNTRRKPVLGVGIFCYDTLFFTFETNPILWRK